MKLEVESLLSNGKLPARRGVRKYFENSNRMDLYEFILNETNFLESMVSLAERIYCIINCITKKVVCPYCEINVPTFQAISTGYRPFCSSACAQKSTLTKQKSQATNLSTRGVKWPQQSADVRNKSIKTNIEKYGVDNVSKSKKIKQKKIDTCIGR